MISGFSVFHLSKKIPEEALGDIFNANEIFKKDFARVLISYSLEQCILLPAKFYDPANNEKALNIMYGDLLDGTLLVDDINKKENYTIYKVPVHLHNILTTQFPKAEFIHQYSVLLKLIPAEDIMKVVFYANKIVVLLRHAGKVRIIQSYKYKTADDIVYHLLNICNQFAATGTRLQLSGMIERDSALFNEIHKYFLDIDFDNKPIPGLSMNMNSEYPAHFFSSLFSIAACG